MDNEDEIGEIARMQDLWAPKPREGFTSLIPVATEAIAKKEEVVSDQNVDLDDLLLPELRLCQPTTEEVKDETHPAKAGQYVLTTTGEVFDPPLQVLLIFHSKGRALFPNKSRGTGDLEQCLSNDSLVGNRYGDCEECDHKEWPSDEEKARNQALTSPPCTLQHNFVVLTESGPAVVRFGRSSFKNGKKFLTAFKWSRDNLWQNVAVLKVKRRDEDQGTYYTHELIWDPRDPVPELYRKEARASFDLLKDLHENDKLGMAGDVEED